MAEDQPPVSAADAALDSTVQTAPADAPSDETDMSSIDQATIDELLRQATFEDPAQANSGGEAPAAAATPSMHAGADLHLPNFQQGVQDAQLNSVDMLRDVDLNVRIELGRSRMLIEDVLKLGEGSVVELDKLAGDPVDVFVNERLVARGEVLVLNDNFCVRINEIVAGVKDEGV